MEVETVEHIAHRGDYTASIVPDSFRAALISTNDFITHSHTVTLSNFYTTIADTGGKYLLHLPRMPDTKE